MQTNVKHFIGIDVSKPFFDVALMTVANHQKQAIESAQFENTEAGLKFFQKWLKNNKVSFDTNTVIVIENTGIYHRLLWAFCHKINRVGGPIAIAHWQCCSHQMEFWYRQSQE